MNRSKKLQYYMALVESVRYDNANGGSYAYMQLLAYNREIMHCMRDLGFEEELLTRVEAVSWIINEYLGAPFRHRHRLVFDEQKFELAEVFREVRSALLQVEGPRLLSEPHARAA